MVVTQANRVALDGTPGTFKSDIEFFYLEEVVADLVSREIAEHLALMAAARR